VTPAIAQPSKLPKSAMLARAALFLAFWAALFGVGSADLLVGIVAAAAATWTSLRLLPPGAQRVRLLPLCALLPRFLWQSLLAGWDVARRALDPRLPLHTGLVRYPVGLAPGLHRHTFAAITSLLPGTVPCGVEDGQLVYHCLDTSQPVVAELAAEEQRLAAFINEAPHA
jgi:multicomponent Na+:H+ antiporter subunit E